jgi:hypothetical protein
MTADAVIREAFGLPGPSTLYGRCNVLSDSSERLLARVVEVLPPWNGAARWEENLE